MILSSGDSGCIYMLFYGTEVPLQVILLNQNRVHLQVVLLYWGHFTALGSIYTLFYGTCESHCSSGSSLELP